MRKIKFDEEFKQEFCKFAKTHTVPEISNRYTLKQATVRRLLFEYNVRPMNSNKSNVFGKEMYTYDDISKESVNLVCQLYKSTNMTVQDICKEVHLKNYIVQVILSNNFSKSFIDSRKSKLYRLSKLGVKNPMTGKFGSQHPNYIGGVVHDGDGYLMQTKPNWYTGRKNSKYVYVHNIVMCELLNLTEIPKGFCVHHIDGNKQNNDISNLALMSISAHGKLHQIERKLQGAETIHNGVGETPNAEQ